MVQQSRITAATAFLLLFASATARSQEQHGAVLTGIVIDSADARPIGGAQVALPELARSVLTDSAGSFRISAIPPGVYHVLIRHIGYRSVDVRFRFDSADSLDRRFILGASAAAFDTVVVTAARSSGIPSFDEHRRIGMGRFLTRAELEGEGERRLGDVLTSFSGVTIVHGRSGQSWVSSKRAAGSMCPPVTSFNGEMKGSLGANCLEGNGVYVPERVELGMGMQIACYAQVYLDGTLMNHGRPTEPFDANSIPLAQLEAVEYYAGPGQTPAQYSGLESRCGVLVLWTRRPQ